jgi:hypothetical protein
VGRIKNFIFGEPGWSNYLFRSPPDQPDARTVYLAGVGLTTALQGSSYVWGIGPTAWLFLELGPIFIMFWGWIWMIVGLTAVGVAFTGHRHPDWDRLAAFAVMMLWWVWGLIYLFSALFAPDDDRQTADLLIGLRLILTGLVLSAGVVQGLRKTHEIWLRERAEDRVRELEQGLLMMAAENEALRLQCEHREPE